MTQLKRILCPVDFSEPSDRALLAATRLAAHLEAELHLLHAVQLPLFVDPTGALLTGGELHSSISQDARAALDARRAEHEGSVTLHQHLAEGLPHQEINRLATELDADLVVLGTHGRTGLKRLLLGSVAERVVRTCPVPVITIPPDSERSGEPLTRVRRIVCPVDFSEASRVAIAFARELADRLGASQLSLLNVFQIPITFVADSGPLIDAELLRSMRAQRKEDMDRLVAEHAGGALAVEGAVLEGVEYRTIVDALEESEDDLVVMATHGRGGVAHLLLGSVAERVVRTSPIPVCTLRVNP